MTTEHDQAAKNLTDCLKRCGLDTEEALERWLNDNEGEVSGGYQLVRVGVDPRTGETKWIVRAAS